MNVPARRSPRIPGYDYSSEGYYFITICTHKKKCAFVSGGRLTQWGKVAAEELSSTCRRFARLELNKWVVMPNHIHAILVVGCDGRADRLPNLNVVVGQYKSAVTRRIHVTAPDAIVWQRSYHDHVIRDENGYRKIWDYIENNPAKWEEDCFYVEE